MRVRWNAQCRLSALNCAPVGYLPSRLLADDLPPSMWVSSSFQQEQGHGGPARPVPVPEGGRAPHHRRGARVRLGDRKPSRWPRHRCRAFLPARFEASCSDRRHKLTWLRDPQFTCIDAVARWPRRTPAGLVHRGSVGVRRWSLTSCCRQMVFRVVIHDETLNAPAADPAGCPTCAELFEVDVGLVSPSGLRGRVSSVLRISSWLPVPGWV